MRRDLHVGGKPYGIGEQKPNHYADMAKVAWQNRRHPLWAWKVLSQGVCDGCALGVAGFRDWTIDGVHLCTTRLKLLELNTADALSDRDLSDVASLRQWSSAELRGLGRLAHPYRRRRGESGFRRVSWDEALGACVSALRATTGERVAIYLTSRGVTNETYYVAGKAARAMGIASIDSAARVCHAPSTLGLKSTIGVAASTCSYSDVLESDLIVLFGSNPANNQPVFMKYLFMARRDHGTKVAVINPYLEPGLDRYWVPSNIESALFGTKMSDLHVPVRPGGDVAFCQAVLRRLIELDALDLEFIAAHTEGWEEAKANLERQPMEGLCRRAGLDIAHIDAFTDLYVAANSAVLIWSMGITQHRDAVAGVQAIVNLALARGNVGRNGAGLMPIRGHSGVQGGAEMGAYATAFPGGIDITPESAAALSEQWGFVVPSTPGLTAPEIVEASERGDLDVLWLAGGNLVEVLPDPRRVERALSVVPARIHQDIVVTPQMLLDADDVILLPAATRYEQEGGGTETTTERRIVFSPEIVGRRVGEARSEWRIFADIATRVRPELAAQLSWDTSVELRAEIARVVPAYRGIESLASTGDAVQWGGRHLCAGGVFPTPSGRGRFTSLDVIDDDVNEGSYVVVTRRGRQFNTMVHDDLDPLNGARRMDVLMDPDDAEVEGFGNGDPIRLVNEHGEMHGRVKVTRLPRHTLQVHWPEGNVLIPSGPEHREPGSKVPDYNAVVRVERPVPPAGGVTAP